MATLEEMIDEKIGEVQTEPLDLSFGEIVNLHSNQELIIQPEYQRLFRWSDEQKSRLIESILLKLPIPQIFVIEKSDSVLELIDGLQRVSSVIQFIEPSALTGADDKPLEPLELQGCDLIKALNGKTFNKLSLTLRLRIKRSPIRTIIIKKRSKSSLRYEMFKRLNTGGEMLSPQEIRNCSARIVGDEGEKFYGFLRDKASYPSFVNCIENLSEENKEKRGDEELVLRFFAAKNATNLFKGSVTDWLDNYMEKILKKEINFEYKAESKNFDQLFDFLAKTLAEGAFVSYKGNQPKGGLKPAYYEAVTVGTFKVLEKSIDLAHEKFKQKIIETVQSDDFRKKTGSGANKKTLLEGRIETIEKALLELINDNE